MTRRREMIQLLPLAACAWGMHPAQAQPVVDEKDTQAAALGYVADASKVDKSKFKQYVAGSQCGGCALYQGKAGAATGPCPLFPGKQVQAKGWCSAFAKKT